MDPDSSALLGNLSGSGQELDVSNWRPDPTGPILVLVLWALYGGVAVQVYRKHRHALEPLHILELNTLVNIFFLGLIRGINKLAIFQLNNSVLCSFIQWLIFYSQINIPAGIVMSQVDRFLALHLHAQYRATVTPELAGVREGSENYYQTVNNKWLRGQFDQTI